MTLRIAHIVGARPQFVKLAPVCAAVLAAQEAQGETLENHVIHTGQHYDAAMSAVFFDELQLAPPDVQLDVRSGSHGAQTGRMLEGIETALLERSPDIVLCYGDTNSTLAGTLAAAKLRMPLAHVEAGLRSFDRHMPEEANRIVADHLADLLFAPTPAAMHNLTAEGLGDRARQVGDVMLDVVRTGARTALQTSQVLDSLRLVAGQFLVATIHRAQSTDGPALPRLLEALNTLARQDRPVVFPVHPRTAQAIRTRLPAWRAAAGLLLIEPLGHLDMLRLLQAAQVVLTDSGGVQKEAFFLGRPCVTLRSETEWVETVAEGGNVIAGDEPAAILRAVRDWDARLARGDVNFDASVARIFGDGAAAARIVVHSVALARAARARRELC